MAAYPHRTAQPGIFSVARSHLRIASAVFGVVPLAMIFTSPIAAQPRSPDVASPAEVLRREYNLQTIGGGNVWINDTERRLREGLTRLDGLRAEIVARQTRLDERIEQNRLAWDSISRQIESLQRTLATLTSDDKKRRPVEQQIAELRRQAIAPDQFGAVPEIRRQVIDLTNLRQTMTLTVLEIESHAARLEESYAHLREDARVVATLRKLGDIDRLGPLDRDYPRAIRALRNEQQRAIGASVPIYVQSGRVRVGAIVNESQPVTVTWLDSQEPTILPRGVVQAAGLETEIAAETLQIQVGRQRGVRVQRLTIPALRIGEAVIRDVPAFVLSPEHEDLGAQISAAAFAGFAVKIEPARLRLSIAPR
jgi:hypothetical protein